MQSDGVGTTMTDEAENTGGTEETGREDVVRRQDFDADGPVEIDLGVGAGRVAVRLADEPGVSVEVRHEPDAGTPWTQGLSSLLSWFSGQFGEGEQADSPAEAVRQTRIDLTASRLVVRTPKALPLRSVPIAVTVRAPAGSHLDVSSGAATVRVTGSCGRLSVSSSSGEVHAERAEGMARISTGSGAVRLGAMLGGLQARTGSGEVDVSSVGAASSVSTGTGDVWLGAVTADVLARTGSGDLTVADAASGRIELITGSGRVRVGVRPGTAAEIDLTSGAGQARSELPLADTPPATEPALRVRGRTGSGSAVATRAAE